MSKVFYLYTKAFHTPQFYGKETQRVRKELCKQLLCEFYFYKMKHPADAQALSYQVKEFGLGALFIDDSNLST